jgi:hypothetical protein
MPHEKELDSEHIEGNHRTTDIIFKLQAEI